MKKLKKVISIILTLTIVFSTGTVFASSGKTQNEIIENEVH